MAGAGECREEATASGRPCQFVGVGIDHYKHGFGVLAALAGVDAIAKILSNARGFATTVLRDVTMSQVGPDLTIALPMGGVDGGALVVLWAGHGEQSAEGRLRLITHDDVANASPLCTADWVAGQAVRTGATQVLLVFDTCSSGQAAIDAAQVVGRLMADLPDPKPVWVGILASAQAYERARDEGLFAAELRRVLEQGPRDPILRLRFNSFNQGVRGDDVIDAVVTEWPTDAQRPEPSMFGRAGILLPNPLYDPDAPERVVEHLLLAAQGRAPDEEGSFFTGRDDQLAEIFHWIGQPEPGVLVVTGPAGSGKSAIVGRIVSLSNPAERTSLLAQGPVDNDPGEGSVDAHVHVRRLTVDRVANLIDEQLCRKGILVQDAQARDRYELLGAVRRLDKPVTIVLDGLDEAEAEAWAIADDLVRDLGRFARVLVATREMARDGGQPLVATLATMTPIDLGDPQWAEQSDADVRRYVRRRLEPEGSGATAMDPALVAEQILHLARANDEGLFLLARVITSQLRTDPVDTSTPGWETALATSVEAALARDLGRILEPSPSGTAGPVAARELLSALAWGYGTGVPDDVWVAFATGLSKTGSRYSLADVYWVLAAAARYVVAADGWASPGGVDTPRYAAAPLLCASR